MIHLKPLFGFLPPSTLLFPHPLLSDFLSCLQLSPSTSRLGEPPSGPEMCLSPPDGCLHHALCLVCLSLRRLVLQIQLSLPRPVNQSRGKSNLSTPPSRDGARHRTHQERGSCFEYSSYRHTPRSLSLDSTDVWSQAAVLCRGGSPVQGGVLNGIIGLYSECW